MNILAQFKHIRLFIFDMDGVLTDGTILIMENGLQARQMSIKDGFALQLAVKLGYGVWVISGGNSPQVTDRLQKLGLTQIHMSVPDKKAFINSHLKQHGFDADETLFMGDDLPDLPAMDVIGIPCCPADAALEIRGKVKYISPFDGGKGCVRDVIEKVLRLNSHWGYHPGVPSK